MGRLRESRIRDRGNGQRSHDQMYKDTSGFTKNEMKTHINFGAQVSEITT